MDPNDLRHMHSLGYTKDALLRFRQAQGGFPQTEEELVRALGLRWPGEQAVSGISLAILPSGSAHLWNDAGVLSLWLTPIMYENRRGMDESLFAFSPVNEDPDREYSLEVNDRVYVYSVAGKLLCEARDEELATERRYFWFRVIVLAAGGALLVVLSARRERPRSRHFYLLWGGAIVSALAVWWLIWWGSSAPLIVDGRHGLFRPDRIDEARAAYTQLLEKYQRAGIISEQTYQRVIRAMTDITPGDGNDAPDTRGAI